MKVAVLKHTRKKVIWPWAVLITLLLVVAIPVGLVYGLFFDDSTKEVTLQEGQTGQSIGNRVIVDSLDPAPEEHHIHAVVTENDVDNLIHYGLEESHFSSKIVKKAYVRVDKNRYKFYADIDLTYFKTRIRFDTILSESGERYDVFEVQKQVTPTGVILKDPLLEEHKVNDRIYRIIYGKTDPKGRYSLRVRDDSDSLPHLLHFKAGNNEYFRLFDFHLFCKIIM